MKILFDQGTPVPLREHLAGHTVDTAYELGWSSLKNSELLRVAEEAGYDLLITTDQNLVKQQNLKGRKLAVLTLLSTSWLRIKPDAEAINQIIGAIQSGEYREFDPG